MTAERFGRVTKISIEEWIKIPDDYPKKLVKNYLKRVKVVVEIRGNRLEQFQPNEIRKEIKEELYIEKNEKKKKLKDF